MTNITITAHDGGTFNAYCAMPASGTGPGLVLLQEAFGVTAFMREMADRYAAAGYIVLVPDLYWRIEPGIELTDAEMDKAWALIGQFDFAMAGADIGATIGTLRAMPGLSGGVGAVGYCLGGRLAAVAASYGAIDCAIVYYGVRVAEDVAALDKAGVPVAFHYGSADDHCATDIAPLQELAARHENMDFWLYEGADHAFANAHRPFYHAEAAVLAEERALAKLGSVLSAK